MKTQEDRILDLLKRAEMGVHPTTIVTETGVLQYNARINGLRTRFNCSHKHNNTICFATEHIINLKNHRNGTSAFFYRKDVVDKNEEHKQWVKKKRAEKLQASLF